MSRTPHRLDDVARAIAKGRGLVFDTMDDEHRREWLLDARHAVMSIVEPTNAMIQRGHDCDFAEPDTIWRVMLGELLG